MKDNDTCPRMALTNALIGMHVHFRSWFAGWLPGPNR